MLEAQKRDRWAPKVGSMVFIPRMKGNFKVGHWHDPVDCISPYNGYAARVAACRQERLILPDSICCLGAPAHCGHLLLLHMQGAWSLSLHLGGISADWWPLCRWWE